MNHVIGWGQGLQLPPGVLDEHLVGGNGRIVMAKRILMILIRAKAEKQIPFIRATSASAPPNDYLKIFSFFELKRILVKH